MAGQLEGKTALITGAASGIGAAIANLYAKEGARVALADLNVDGCDEQARLLHNQDRHSTHVVDVADASMTETLIESVVNTHGQIDILVNSAGISAEVPLLDLTIEQFDKMIAVNLRSVFLCSRWAAPHMVKQKSGRIINISSQLGLKGGVNLVHYTAAKAGVLGLTKAMARELAPHNVLVNAIAPGPVLTPLFRNLSNDWRDAKLSELPLGRFGVPEEIAPSALLLASSPGGDLYVGQTLGPNSGDVMP